MLDAGELMSRSRDKTVKTRQDDTRQNPPCTGVRAQSGERRSLMIPLNRQLARDRHDRAVRLRRSRRNINPVMRLFHGVLGALVVDGGEEMQVGFKNDEVKRSGWWVGGTFGPRQSLEQATSVDSVGT